MWAQLRRFRYLGQYRRIVAVLTRHGLGWLADQAGLSRFFSWFRRPFRRERAARLLPSFAQRLSRAAEELGPTYVLLGRYLGARPDLLPPALCRELSYLSPGRPLLPAGEVAGILQQELGQAVEDLFAEFEPDPWRWSWFGQTHRARTPDGRPVWVTVLDEAARSVLAQDRPVLQELARMVDEARGRWWSAREVVRQFDGAVYQQFDLREQGRNAERWQRLFAGRDQPVFPEVDWQRSAGRVLTCSALPGRSLEAIAAAHAGDQDDLARALYRFLARAIFEHGFYPTPLALDGLVVLEDGRLAVTALAPVNQVDRASRNAVLRLLEAFGEERVGEIVEIAVSLGIVGRRQVSAAAYQAVRHLVERYGDLPPAELRLEELAEDLFALVHRRAIVLPEELSQMLCALVAVEDLGRRLAPQVDAFEEVACVVREAMAELHSWRSRQERLLRAGRAWMEALRSLPVDVRDVLSQAAQGDLSVGVEPRAWQRPMRRLERMAHRLVLSVLAGGLLIALSLLVTALLPASWGPWGWVLAGLALFALLGLGFLLALSFLRRG